MEHDAVWAGCSIEHEGHFQMGPATDLVERGGETPNIGTFGAAILTLVGVTIEAAELALDFSTIEGVAAFRC